MGYPTREQTEAELGWLDSERVRLTAELAELTAQRDWLLEHHADIVTDYRSGGVPVYWISGSGDLDSYDEKIDAVAAAMKLERSATPTDQGGTNG